MLTQLHPFQEKLPRCASGKTLVLSIVLFHTDLSLDCLPCSCEVICDQRSGESLQYAFIEFEKVGEIVFDVAFLNDKLVDF